MVQSNQNLPPQQPAISVIMPCYNAALVIEKTIEDLFQQTFNAFELIIVDDGSTDDSLLKLEHLSKRYPEIRIFSQFNQGPGPARNQGIQVAQADLIAFLDSDDSWHPEFLAKLYQSLQDNPDCALAYCGWQNIGLAANQCQPYIPPNYEEHDKLATLLRSCPWPIHAALTRKTAIDKVNGFNQNWLTAEDFDMWLRIAAFSKIVRVPEVLAFYHHQQGEQISKNRARAVLNHWGVQKAFIKDFPETVKLLGKSKIDHITDGQLLHHAYDCYWKNDLQGAHHLFRKSLKLGSFSIKDLKYLLPTLLPYNIYRSLIEKLRQ
ncbi:glycosyltransferase family A protein [Methylomonas montana]|uniref:glycosyltransferase family 2 protein n=1 Tax=Methylomonas montana TaxID=3058963 RepID=UPI0026583E6D|nr:glycosyltransferase family A protein [Methylomonas montana]WKJ88728.1 glycosyltransferase family A protein [Methylomonas montana]